MRSLKGCLMKNARTAILVEAALCIALSAVLGLIKLWEMPQGGSISLEMLPLIVFAMRRGVGPGVFAGVLYGVVNYLLAPVTVHWVQVLLDYPVAHGLVGLAGIFAPLWRRMWDASPRKAVGAALLPGVAIGVLGRFCAAFVSGVVFFSQYAPEGMPGWLYSLAYNGTYLPVSGIVCSVAAIAVMPMLERRLPAS